MRERKMFSIFTLLYTILIFSTSFSIHLLSTNDKGTFGRFALYFLCISFGFSLFLSVLYALLIVTKNRRTWAILKCIGWTNSNINSLITGIVLYTTLIGFIVVVEILLHYAAIMIYLQSAGVSVGFEPILIQLLPVVLSFLVFLFVQLFAILLANRKVLKVRPMLALKKPGE